MITVELPKKQVMVVYREKGFLEDPNSGVLGPTINILNGFWCLAPDSLVSWTLTLAALCNVWLFCRCCVVGEEGCVRVCVCVRVFFDIMLLLFEGGGGAVERIRGFGGPERI